MPSASQQISRPPTHYTIDVRSINTLAPVKISRAILKVYKGALRVRLSETLRLAAARWSSIRDIRWSKIDCGTRKVGIKRTGNTAMSSLGRIEREGLKGRGRRQESRSDGNDQVHNAEQVPQQTPRA